MFHGVINFVQIIDRNYSIWYYYDNRKNRTRDIFCGDLRVRDQKA